MIAAPRPAAERNSGMRSLVTFSLVVLMTAALSPALASEAETIKAINASSNELDKGLRAE
jgi:hypothetical protein